jgi:hypothetical protein
MFYHFIIVAHKYFALLKKGELFCEVVYEKAAGFILLVTYNWNNSGKSF